MFNLHRCFLAKESAYCALSFLAAFNALLPSILFNWRSHTAAAAISSGLGQNLTIWLAILSSVYLLLKYPFTVINHRNAGITQHLLVLSLALLLLIPNATLSWLISALASFFWWIKAPLNSASRNAALLMIAVAMRDPLSLLGLNLFTEQLLGFDRYITQTMLNVSFSGTNLSNIVIGEQFNLVILTGCSSFTNISLAVLFWLNLSILLHKTTHKTDCLRLLLLITLCVLCNSFRLSLMSKSLPDYQFYHLGFGAQLFSYLSTFMVLICLNWRISHAKYLSNSAANDINLNHSRGISPYLPRL
ncbi:MAG: hypothetical protein HRU06_04170 [Oceanospirillaceae bacterium]|nr:hypothetical protein [Oceanospirillaceae bacterium]